MTPAINRVTRADIPDLLPLLRAYCSFYRASPSDRALRALATALTDDLVGEGLQLLARDDGGRPVGFATVFWSWSTTDACRIGVMNDLFVVEAARGSGLGARLIRACRDACAERGARRLVWQTAPENLRAQALYARVGATREQWIDYWLPVP